MADGVLLPLTGSGAATATVATDDAGAAGHVQLVKLALSADGSATALTADNTLGLLVAPTQTSVVGQVSVAGTATVQPLQTSVVGQVSVVGTPNVQPLQTSVVGQVTVMGTVTTSAGQTSVVGQVTVVGTVTTSAGQTSVVGQVSVVGTPNVQPLQTSVVGQITVVGTVTVANVTCVGNVADGTAASGNPITNGLTARQTNRTAVADGAVVRMAADDMGRVLTQVHQPRDLISHTHTQIATTTETTIVAQIASTFLDLISLVVTSQTATAVNVTIKDSAAGTARMVLALAASGGAVICPSGIIPQLAAAGNAWTATLSATGITVNVFAHYAKNL